MTTKVIRQILPAASPEYDPRQMHQMIQALSSLIDEVRNPLTNIPALPGVEALSTLRVGDLYQENGFVKIKTGLES
jgi:hypothetical protein